jgi:hypothetical protein
MEDLKILLKMQLRVNALFIAVLSSDNAQVRLLKITEINKLLDKMELISFNLKF